MKITLDYNTIADAVTAGLILAGILAFCNYTIKFAYRKIKETRQRRYKKKIELKKSNAVKKSKVAKDTEKEKLLEEIAELNRRLADPEKYLQEEKERIASLQSALERESNEIGNEKLNEAKVALENGDFSKADEIFAEIQTREELAVKRAARAANARGEIAEQEVRWTDAFKHYNRAALLDPTFKNLLQVQEVAFDIGDYDSALSFGIKAKEVAIAEYNEESEEYARIINNLATLYKQHAQYDKAELLYNEALEIRKRVFKENHPAIAVILNNLAGLYYLQGQYETAEKLYQKALKIEKVKLGINNPVTANSFSNLAEVYREQGKYEAAEPLFKKAIQIFRKVFRNKHPILATSINNLALLYDSQERYEEAEELHNESLMICREVLGNNHPDTANSLNNLGGVYYSQEKYKKAEPFCKEAWEIFETNFGPDHPMTKITKTNYEEVKELIANAENDASQ